jgi:hypothetical protein
MFRMANPSKQTVNLRSANFALNHVDTGQVGDGLLTSDTAANTH